MDYGTARNRTGKVGSIQVLEVALESMRELNTEMKNMRESLALERVTARKLVGLWMGIQREVGEDATIQSQGAGEVVPGAHEVIVSVDGRIKIEGTNGERKVVALEDLPLEAILAVIHSASPELKKIVKGKVSRAKKNVSTMEQILAELQHSGARDVVEPQGGDKDQASGSVEGASGAAVEPKDSSNRFLYSGKFGQPDQANVYF